MQWWELILSSQAIKTALRSARPYPWQWLIWPFLPTCMYLPTFAPFFPYLNPEYCQNLGDSLWDVNSFPVPPPLSFRSFRSLLLGLVNGEWLNPVCLGPKETGALAPLRHTPTSPCRGEILFGLDNHQHMRRFFFLKSEFSATHFVFPSGPRSTDEPSHSSFDRFRMRTDVFGLRVYINTNRMGNRSIWTNWLFPYERLPHA